MAMTRLLTALAIALATAFAIRAGAVNAIVGRVVDWRHERTNAQIAEALGRDAALRTELTVRARPYLDSSLYLEGMNPVGPCPRHHTPLVAGCSTADSASPFTLETLEYLTARILYFPISGTHTAVTRGQCYPVTRYEERAVLFCEPCREIERVWWAHHSAWSTAELAANIALLASAPMPNVFTMLEHPAPNPSLQRTRYARR